MARLEIIMITRDCYYPVKTDLKKYSDTSRTENLIEDHRSDTSKLHVVYIYDENNHRESHNSSFLDRTRFRKIELGSVECESKSDCAEIEASSNISIFRIGQRGKDIECEFFQDGRSNIKRVGTKRIGEFFSEVDNEFNFFERLKRRPLDGDC